MYQNNGFAGVLPITINMAKNCGGYINNERPADSNQYSQMQTTYFISNLIKPDQLLND